MSTPRTVGIIQARLGSTRLPRKVLSDLAGQTMLERVVERVRAAGTIHEVVVATTDHPRDDVLVALADEKGWPCIRGSEQDVLSRYYAAAQAYQADAVVRVCSDCPLTDPDVLDALVTLLHADAGHDYVANNFDPASYPKGLDAEAFTAEALEVAWEEDTRPEWREHVTPYIRQHPERFRHGELRSSRNYAHMRWTVDVPADLELMRRIYRHILPTTPWRQVVALLDANPGWVSLNAHITQRTVSSRERDETTGGRG